VFTLLYLESKDSLTVLTLFLKTIENIFSYFILVALFDNYIMVLNYTSFLQQVFDNTIQLSMVLSDEKEYRLYTYGTDKILSFALWITL
jgi:hypothetical protein